jgi:small subunit ribosomal protein S16
LIVIDSRKRRDGASIEQIGWYNPIDPKHSYEIMDDRILYWLGEGAIPSNAVKKIMKRDGLALRWHLMQQGVDEKEIEIEIKKWELNREDTLASREAKEAEKLEKKKEKPEVASAKTDEPAAEESGSDESEAASAKTDEPAAEESSDNTGEEE